MPFLYHRVPKNMRGTILYPLNVLKEKFPDTYHEHAKKYVGREHVMDTSIPNLGCRWNDVLHLTALHPSMVADALAKLGQTLDWSVYEIDAERFDPAQTVVYRYSHEASATTADADFLAYDPAHLDAFAILPDATVRYYEKCVAEGRSPLVYHRVPHILYRGSIDVGDANIIDIRRP